MPPQERESYTIKLRMQTRSSHRKAIFQWLKSHDKSTQQDLIMQAVEAFYRCYSAQFEGLSEQQLWQIYHFTKGQIKNHFYNLFISLFGYEKSGIVANQYFPNKEGMNQEKISQPKFNQSLENEDELYGDIDEDLDDNISF